MIFDNYLADSMVDGSKPELLLASKSRGAARGHEWNYRAIQAVGSSYAP